MLPKEVDGTSDDEQSDLEFKTFVGNRMNRFRQEPLNQTTGGLNHFADRGLKIEHKGLSVEGKNSCPFAKFAAKSSQKSFLYMRVQIFKTLSKEKEKIRANL